MLCAPLSLHFPNSRALFSIGGFQIPPLPLHVFCRSLSTEWVSSFVSFAKQTRACSAVPALDGRRCSMHICSGSCGRVSVCTGVVSPLLLSPTNFLLNLAFLSSRKLNSFYICLCNWSVCVHVCVCGVSTVCIVVYHSFAIYREERRQFCHLSRGSTSLSLPTSIRITRTRIKFSVMMNSKCFIWLMLWQLLLLCLLLHRAGLFKLPSFSELLNFAWIHFFMFFCSNV